MERLVIIDHGTHTLFVEDVSNEDLAKYNGSEEDYIRDNYTLENFSWDYITSAEYLSVDNKDPMEIDFDNL